jgi:hypothetical protein
MKRLKTNCLLVITVIGLCVVVPSVASAAEMTLPEFTVATPGTDVSGAGTLFGPIQIKCKKDKSQFLFNSGTHVLGTFTFDFEECTLGGEECHSLGDAAGIILDSGEWHLVLDTLSMVDHHLIWWLLKELHIECKFLSVLLLFKGNNLGTITGSKTEFIIEMRAKGAKEQEFKEFENNKGEKVKAQLLVSEDGGTFEEAALESEDILKFEKATEIIN